MNIKKDDFSADVNTPKKKKGRKKKRKNRAKCIHFSFNFCQEFSLKQKCKKKEAFT